MRKFRNLFDDSKLAHTFCKEEFPVLVKSHSSFIVRKLHGVDIKLQENKLVNIELACRKINGIVINPGETFSFWKLVGRTTGRKGYKEGLVITKGGLKSGIGGGLCQMGNMIHFLILNSPLTVTELHHHSDALFPDERRRVPFGSGTSICYNNLDYRFKNTTDFPVQILVWRKGEALFGELRSMGEYPLKYKLVEENHHFQKEGDTFYRISQVYKIAFDAKSGEEVSKEMILDNHSKVMYDYSLIPQDQIWENEENVPV